MNAIITILEKSAVPWNQYVRDLVKVAFEYDHPLLETIKKKVKLQPILIIFNKPEYKLQRFQFDKEHVSAN